MNLEREIKINKILLILLITLSVGTIALRTSHAMFSKKETFNNVLRIITGNELPSKSGAEDLIKKAGVTGEGLQGLDPETGTLCTNDCKEYRYVGLNVNNYVKLTNLNPTNLNQTQEELWRIIGIFKDEDNGEWFLRIVRNEMLLKDYLPYYYVVNGTTYVIDTDAVKVVSASPNGAYWNLINPENSGPNDWSQAGLQYYLNSEKDSQGHKGYMSYLSSDTKAMLRNTKHYLGAVTEIESTLSITDTTLEAYKYEREIAKCTNNKGLSTNTDQDKIESSGCRVYNGHAATWPSKISLMYASDYGYSANNSYWNTTQLSNYNNLACNTSWIYKTMPNPQRGTTWFITPTTYTTLSSAIVSILAEDGRVSGFRTGNNFGGGNGVRPVLNILSNVKIKDGTEGTETNPYILSIE